MEEEPKYFEAALSDFIYDMASGGAICHLADAGYSVNQIMEKLDFPTPRERVVKTVYQHMLESGMLLLTLPEKEDFFLHRLWKQPSVKELHQYLQERIQKNGEKDSYVSCPFGSILREAGREEKQAKESLHRQLSCLTGSEQDYILDIPWQQDVMYHRLNGRMLEIGKQLAANTDMELRFYFLNTKEALVCG